MSDINKTTGRREFLKFTSITALGAFAIAKIVGSTSTARAADAPLEMVKTSDPMAQSLGYHEDGTKVDTKKWAKRAGKDGAKQFCFNCQFYQSKDPNRKATKSAPCTIFQNKGVHSHGWCNTWTEDKTVKG
jgi:hypothetical protein